MSQAPAYQMYAGDWLKSRSVRFMADYQRGWYIQLLNEAWDGTPQCMLPKNEAELQMLAGVSDLTRSQPDFNERWTAVKRMFKEDGEFIYNERQMHELAKQEQRRQSAIKAGNASAKKRQEKRKELQRIKKQHLTEGNGRSTDVQRQSNEETTLQPSTSDSNLQTSNSTNTPIVPKGTKNSRAKKIDRVKENTPTMKRIGSWFNRGETTLWSQHEADKLASVKPSPEELTLMESYYQLTGEKAKYRRKDVATLLNNWVGELDRARNATEAASQPRKKPKNTEFDRVLNDILKACKQIEDTGRIAEYLESCWDKYKDIPKQGGVNVIQRAKEML